MYLILFLGGAIVGSIIQQIPERIFSLNVPLSSRKEFLRQYPEKRWLTWIFPSAYFVCFFFVGIFFYACFQPYWPANAKPFVFFFPLSIQVGVGIPAGLIEIFARVQSKYYKNPAACNYAVQQDLYICGALRLLLYLVVMTAAWYFCVVHTAKVLPVNK